MRAKGYYYIHRLINKLWGSATICELCGRTDAKRYEWSNIDHKYSRNREDWQQLCKGCHRKYDMKTFGFEVWNKGKTGVITPEHRAKMAAALKAKPAWNKGKKTGLVPKTAFKKGNMPWNKSILPYG